MARENSKQRSQNGQNTYLWVCVCLEIENTSLLKQTNWFCFYRVEITSLRKDLIKQYEVLNSMIYMWIDVLAKFHNIAIVVRKRRRSRAQEKTEDNFYNVREW